MVKGKCPLCKSTAYTVSKPESTFQFIGNRVCQACGTIWIPPCPKWGAVITIIAGVIITVFGNCMVVAMFHPADQYDKLKYPGAPWLLLGILLVLCNSVTLTTVIYGIKVLAGKTGKLQIITEGKLPDNSKEHNAITTQPSLKQFGQIRWYHLVVGMFIPFVALPWGVLNITREKWRSGLVLLGLSLISLAIFIAMAIGLS